jgi:hemoglobin-like flavoprotein
MDAGPELFISYAHEDLECCQEFRRMLAPACERGLISIWSDAAIEAGDRWFETIQQALTRARVGLLLVSDHFLQSQFIHEQELAALLAAGRRGEVSIFWVPVSASLYAHSDLKDLQACWDPERPLDQLPQADRKAAIQKICLEIVDHIAPARPAVSQGRRASLLAQVQERLHDRYAVSTEIGSGKFSIVYDAVRQELQRTVAVKAFVVSELDEWARRSFNECLERAVTLTSPAFIKIFDHFMDEPPEIVVSEYVDGEQLSSVLQRYPNGMPLEQVKSILHDLLTAVAEAHAHGWRRGELCPSDVLIEKSGGRARLSPIDFSNLLREELQIRGDFLVDRESLAYMTPERYWGREASLLTDQYSLGLIAAELLGGPRVPRVVRPCDLETKPQVFAELEEGRGAWATRSKEFARVVLPMLRVDPQKRWPSLAALCDLVERIPTETAEERDRRLATMSYVALQAGSAEGEPRFYHRFYESLLAAAPDVRRHFDGTHMERQYGMLDRAIRALLAFDPETPSLELRALAARHAGFELAWSHYQAFIEVLVRTIQEAGEADTDALAAWRNTLTRGIQQLWQCEQDHRAHCRAAAPAGRPVAPPASDGAAASPTGGGGTPAPACVGQGPANGDGAAADDALRVSG